MPDRILRASLFRSHRFLSLPDAACCIAYVACIADADDLGNFEAEPGQLRLLWATADRPDLAAVERIAHELALTDLIRWYTDLSTGKRLGHIPRFRQRLRSIKRAYARPPPDIEDNEINDKASKLSDERPAIDRHTPDNRPAFAGSRAPAESNRIEVNRIESNRSGHAPASTHTPASAHTQAPQGFFQKLKTELPQLAKPPTDESDPEVVQIAAPPAKPNGAGRTNAHAAKPLSALTRGTWKANQASIAAVAASLELRPQPGETFAQLADRCAMELRQRNGA